MVIMNIRGSLAKYILLNVTEDIYRRGLEYVESGKVARLGE